MKLRQTTVQLGKRAGFDDVGYCLGLTTVAQIGVCKTPSLSTLSRAHRPLRGGFDGLWMFRSTCLFVCPEHNSKTSDRIVFKLGIGNVPDLSLIHI